jgi:tetratricopeptide (TPR) repeat protein
VLAAAHAAAQLLFLGSTELSNQLTEVVLGAREEARADPVIAACVSRVSANRAYRAGDVSFFVREMERVVAGFHWQGNLRAACFEGSNLGFGLMELGAYERAEGVLRSVLAQAERMGMINIASSARQNLGLTLARLGRLDEARAMEERSIEDFLQAGDLRMAGGSSVYLAKIFLEADRPAEARAVAEAGARQGEAFPSIRAGALACVAEADLVLGDLAAAQRSAAEAERLLDGGDVEEGDRHVRLVIGLVHRAAGDAQGAALRLREAAARLHEQASRIGDAALRTSFLERVPENRRTIEAAR